MRIAGFLLAMTLACCAGSMALSTVDWILDDFRSKDYGELGGDIMIFLMMGGVASLCVVLAMLAVGVVAP